MFFLCSRLRDGREARFGRPGRRLIDGAAKARFLAGLRAGAARDAAAEAAGFPLKSLYGARRRDPVLCLAWEWARELAAVDERGGELSRRREEGERIRIAPKNGRLLQRQRMRWVSFTARRQQIFLDHFAGTADLEASAAAAGVSAHTVRTHYRKHPEFAAAFEEALRVAYAFLDAEALRQRLEAQRSLKENLEPAGEMAAEFERVLKLLARWDRRNGRPALRHVGHGRQRRWTFEEAICALDRKLDNLGVYRGLLPEDGAPEKGDG